MSEKERREQELAEQAMENEGGVSPRAKESTPDKGGSDRKNEQPSAEGVHGS